MRFKPFSSRTELPRRVRHTVARFYGFVCSSRAQQCDDSGEHVQGERQLSVEAWWEALQKADFSVFQGETSRELCEVSSGRMRRMIIALWRRCYVTIRVAKEAATFQWSNFVADVFNVKGEEREIKNGERHLKEIYSKCAAHFDSILAEALEEAIVEKEAIADQDVQEVEEAPPPTSNEVDDSTG